MPNILNIISGHNKSVVYISSPQQMRQHAARDQSNAIAGKNAHVHCPVNV